MKKLAFWLSLSLFLLVAVGAACAAPAAAKYPERSIEFVIMAGTGGGADRYARFMSALVDKNKLSPQSLVPVNKPGGAGAVAMDYLNGKKGDPYFIMITLTSYVTTPLVQKLPFNYKTFSNIALVGTDIFMLWVPADSPFKTAKDFLDEAKKREITVAGTGSKQEDEILFRLMEKEFGLKSFKYVPFPGGGEVAAALVGKQVEATVNNPSEQLSFFKDKRSTPLAVFLKNRVQQPLWKDVPTIKEAAGKELEYLFPRVIVAPADIPPSAKKWLVDLMKKTSDTEEFQKFLVDNALVPKFLSGIEVDKFMDDYSKLHGDLMKSLGWTQ